MLHPTCSVFGVLLCVDAKTLSCNAGDDNTADAAAAMASVSPALEVAAEVAAEVLAVGCTGDALSSRM